MTGAIFDTTIFGYVVKSTKLEKLRFFHLLISNQKFYKPNFPRIKTKKLDEKCKLVFKFKSIVIVSMLHNFVWLSGLNDNELHCLRPPVVQASNRRVQRDFHINTSDKVSKNYHKYQRFEKTSYTQLPKTHSNLDPLMRTLL